MKKIKYLLIALASLLMFSACSNDDEPSTAKAVMASAQILDFDGLDAMPQVITVYSDATWTVDAPEWITVTPSTGSGTTDVTVSVSDNLRDGYLDNPRKAELIFHGATIASRACVKVIQKGDNYRDCQKYKVREIFSLEDEQYVDVENIKVCAVLSDGVVVTDDYGLSNVAILTKEKLKLGQSISVLGQKLTDSYSLPFINSEKIEVNAGESTLEMNDPKDITSILDSFESTEREYVTVTGILEGTTVKVNQASNSVSLTDIVPSQNITPLNGHIVKVSGFFAGVASPYVRINMSDIEDLGEAQIIYWSEDFEWLNPYAEASGAGRTVETNDLEATAPQIVNAKLSDGSSALDALLAKGYEFLRVTTKTEGECIYLQQNYLKFGKTSYQAGIRFPSIDNIPSGAKVLLSFDWCPMRQASGKIDPVNLILIVRNGDNEVTFEIPTHDWPNGHRLEWITETIELTGVTINKDTQITLRQTQWPAATANRWFLDNIKFFSKF